MFPIAGQTAGPIGLKFFVDTHGWPGVIYISKKKICSKIFFYFHGQRRALQLVRIKASYDIIRRNIYRDDN